MKNVNKGFTAIPTMSKYRNHTIDNKVKISESSNDFFRSFIKSLKLKFPHPKRRSIRKLMLSSTSNHEENRRAAVLF